MQFSLLFSICDFLIITFGIFDGQTLEHWTVKITMHRKPSVQHYIQKVYYHCGFSRVGGTFALKSVQRRYIALINPTFL